jgi:hypothetical protein
MINRTAQISSGSGWFWIVSFTPRLQPGDGTGLNLCGTVLTKAKTFRRGFTRMSADLQITKAAKTGRFPDSDPRLSA